MLKEEVKTEIWREPFVPLRLHLSNGKKFDIPFREVARVLSYGILVFIGMKEGTHLAEGYDRFSFDQIIRIEHARPKDAVAPRRKRPNGKSP